MKLAHQVAEEIKERIHMQDIFDRYGFTPNKMGFIICPFHNEKTASLRAYKEGKAWHCFGCGENGDVISFVMKLYDLTFPQAIIRLDNDFCLQLMNQKQDLRAKKRARQQLEFLAFKKQVDQEEKELYQQIDCLMGEAYQYFLKMKEEHAPKSMVEAFSDEYATACHALAYLDYLLEQ